MAAPVRIYLTEWCPFCVRARKILDSRSVSYEAIDVDGDFETRAWLREATGQRTVPQIFIGEKSIGGCSELETLVARDQLDGLLAAEAS